MPDLQSPQGKQEEEPTIQTPKGSSESEEELIVPSVEPRAIADGELEPVDTIVIKDGESYRQMRVYSAKRGAKETEEHNCKECGFKSVDFDEYKDHMKAHNTPVGSQGEAKSDWTDSDWEIQNNFRLNGNKAQCKKCFIEKTKKDSENWKDIDFLKKHEAEHKKPKATESMDCEFCEGKGKVIVEKKGIKECPRCEGEGTVESNQPNQEQISQDVEVPQEVPQQEEMPPQEGIPQQEEIPQQEVPVEEEVPQVEEEEFIDETPEEEHFNLDNFKDEEGKESKANEKEQWITMSGNHILVKDGQTKKQAVSDFLDNVDDDLKSSKKDEPKGKKEDKPKKDKMDKTDYSSKKDFYFKNDDDTIEKKSMTLDEYEKVKDDYKETGWSEAGKKPSQLQKEYDYDETYKKFEEDNKPKEDKSWHEDKDLEDLMDMADLQGISYNEPTSKMEDDDVGNTNEIEPSEEEKEEFRDKLIDDLNAGVPRKEDVSEEQAKDFWNNLDDNDKVGDGIYEDTTIKHEYDRLTPTEQMAVKERYTDQFKSREQLHKEFRALKEKYPKEYGMDEHYHVDDTERLLRGKSTRLSWTLNSGKKTKDNTIVVSDNTDFISGKGDRNQDQYEEIFEPTQVEGKDGTWEFGGSYTNEKQMKRLAKMAKKDGTLTKGNVKTLMDEAVIDADPSENKPIAFKLGGKTYWTAPINPNYEAEEVKAMESYQTFIKKQIKSLQSKAKSGESVGLLYGQEVETDGRKIKGTLAYAGVSLNDRIYLPEELAKGDGLTLPLLLNHSSISGAEMELDRLDGSMKSSLENGQDFRVGEVTLEWIPEKLTLYYEGEVTDPFFQKEIDDANMSVSLGIYYDSDSPSVCNDKCYTVITGAEFREVSLVYHAGFPIATIEEVESGLKKLGESVSKSKCYECVSCKDGGLLDATENDIKSLKCLNCGDVNWTRMNQSLEAQLLPQLYLPDMTMEGMKIPTVIIQKSQDTDFIRK